NAIAARLQMLPRLMYTMAAGSTRTICSRHSPNETKPGSLAGAYPQMGPGFLFALCGLENSGASRRQNFMHDTPDQVHWHEPKAGENAGYGKFLRKPMPYDSFMESEGVPIHRGIGVRRVQDLPMADWKRLGGRGSYIQL